MKLPNGYGSITKLSGKRRRPWMVHFLKRGYSVFNAEFDMNHLFHDTRHTFISQAQRYRLNEFCLKRIVGHSGHGVTQNVYTHVEVPELLREINKIP